MRYVNKHDSNSESDANTEKKMFVDNEYLLNYKSFFTGSNAVLVDSAVKFKVAYINLKQRESVGMDLLELF